MNWRPYGMPALWGAAPGSQPPDAQISTFIAPKHLSLYLIQPCQSPSGLAWISRVPTDVFFYPGTHPGHHAARRDCVSIAVSDCCSFSLASMTLVLLQGTGVGWGRVSGEEDCWGKPLLTLLWWVSRELCECHGGVTVATGSVCTCQVAQTVVPLFPLLIQLFESRSPAWTAIGGGHPHLQGGEATGTTENSRGGSELSALPWFLRPRIHTSAVSLCPLLAPTVPARPHQLLVCGAGHPSASSCLRGRPFQAHPCFPASCEDQSFLGGE